MKKVITVGVYDYFHIGHLKLFKNAKKLGDYLIVAVQDGDCILKTKPDAKVLYTTEQRIEMVSELRTVDEVIIYEDVDKTIAEVDFDVFAIGETRPMPDSREQSSGAKSTVRKSSDFREHLESAHQISRKRLKR